MHPSGIDDLGSQYGAEYFERYGRGPYSYETTAPYRHGEPLWERYFGQIADLIASELAPRTVLDAGCAIGFLVEALRKRDIEAWGLDVSEFAIEHVPESIRDFCFRRSVTDDLERDYDLIVCLEVLEHLPGELAAPTVANLCRHADQVLFSASPDGFRDPTHLNVQPTHYWVELFARYGFFRNIDVDASVAAPQAIHLARANRTPVSIAADYERWHWRMLSELRDLREARQVGAEAVVRAEHAEEKAKLLRRQLEEREASALESEIDLRGLRRLVRKQKTDVADLRRKLHEREAAAGRVELELIARDRVLAELADREAAREAAARRVEAEMAAIQRKRLFRYTAWPRRVYASLLYGAGGVRPAEQAPDDPPPEQAPEELPPREQLIRHWLEHPVAGQAVESDLLLPVNGWVFCMESPVARVDIVVNGVECGRARLGLVRHDVAAAFATPSALLSGFEALVDLRAVTDYESGVRIELRVETLAGDRHTLDAGHVELLPPEEEEKVEEDQTPGAGDAKSPRSAARSVRRADIRLLVFTHDLGLGGGQLYLFELLRLLAAHDDFAATVVAPSGGPLRRAIEALGIPVLIDGAPPIGSIDAYEGRQAQLMVWAREADFNVVLGNTVPSFPGIDLAARLSLPAVWAIHESFELSEFWRAAYGSADAVHPLVKARAESAFASAAAVVFEADATRDLYVHHGDASRFITIPYGIDIGNIDRFAASVSPADARALLGLRPESTLLLCLGTIEPRKAQLPLAEAFRAVAAVHVDADLAFVGARQDPFSEGLEAFVNVVGLGGRVRIEPVTDEIYTWYRAADALICGSDVESLPRTVLEAMAFSVPVIATRVFGLPELIEDGVTGYLCEPRDTAQLAQAIDRFLNTTDEERASVGAAGAAVVRKRHDSRGYGDAYHRLLRSLIEDSSCASAEILPPR